MESQQIRMIGVDEPTIERNKSESITLSRPTMPGLASKMTGVNILQTVNQMTDLEERLRRCGVSVLKILYFPYTDGTTRPRLLYCRTLYGQNVMIEPPEGLVAYGHLCILDQRVGVLPTNITEHIAESLKNIHTGYCFIVGGGIHYVSKPGAEPQFFGYEKYLEAERHLDVSRLSYELIPAVAWNQLVEPARLNTIEAHFARTMAGSPFDQAMHKAGLVPMLTMSNQFSLFLPLDEQLRPLLALPVEQLRSILLAHIVTEFIPYATEQDEMTTHFALSQNQLTINRTKGVIVFLSTPDGKRIKLAKDKPIQKYNGIIYRIESPLTPKAAAVQIPESSDLDSVATIFDINRSTMDIRLAQYGLNAENMVQETKALMDRTMESIKLMYGEANGVQNSILARSNADGTELIQNSNTLLTAFFNSEVPCQTECKEINDLNDVVFQQNIRYGKLLKASSRIASLRFDIEKIILQLAKAKQSLDVDNPVEGIVEEESDSDSE